MDGVESQLVALETVATSFSHFIIEHWVPAQAILIDLHNSTCPSCQRADAMANNGGLVSKSIQSGQAVALPVPPPNSRQGETSSLISPIPSLIFDSSTSSTLLYFFAGERQRFQERLGLSVYIDKVPGLMSSFFSSDEREVGSNEGISEALEGSGYGSGSCQGHSTLSSQRVCEGAWLTQLVLLVTAGRLFPCHKGRVDP